MQPFFGPVGLFYRSSGMQLPRKGQSMYEYKWNRAVGWLWPEAKLEERFDAGSPRELRGTPLAWWRVVGPETRCPLRWRRDLRLRSAYAASSVTFAACGVAAAAAFRAGQEKGANIPTSKARISVVFHSFRLSFGRVIISRNDLERKRFASERARAERPR